MGTVERKQRQKEEVHHAILKAAWTIVKEEGWQGLSIRKIAEIIEYSVPVVYDHFENKESILAEFTRRGFSLLNEKIKEVLDEEMEPEKQVRSVALAYWQFAASNIEYYQLMYGMGMPGCEAVNEMEELLEFTSLLSATIRGLGGDNEGMRNMKSLWSMLHGLVSIRMMDDSGDPLIQNEVFEQSVSNFLSGMRIWSNNKQL